MSDKAQVSNFMILAVIIMIIAAVFFFVRSNILEKVQPEVIIPPEYQGINNFVQQCVKDKAKEAIIILGQQGGYISIPYNIRMDPNAYLRPVQGGTILVPYWFYAGQDRSPFLSDMEREIDAYVALHMEECIQDFSAFDDVFSVESGDVTVKTTIADEDVVVSVDYPLHVTKLDNGQVGNMDQFTVKLDVKLKKIYELSSALMDSENEGLFLENTTIDLMVLNTEIPFTDLKISCDRNIWSKRKITGELKEMLYYNVPRLKVEGTDYIPYGPDYPYEKYHFMWDPSDRLPNNRDFTDLTVGLEYQQSWPLTLVVRPSDGDRLQSNVGEGTPEYFSLMCINLFHFTYDVTYPVLIKIKDMESFSGEGYVFNFATPVYINHNKGQRDSFATSGFWVPQYEGSFCDDMTEETYTIKAIDRRTGMDIEGVNLTFGCITRSCNIGLTEFDGKYFRLKTPLPTSCSGGTITATSDNYITENRYVSLESLDTEESIDISMQEVKNVKFDVFKHSIDNPLFRYRVLEGQNVILSLKNNATGYTVFKIFPGVAGDPENDTVKLVMNDSAYTLDFMLLDDNDNLLGGFKGEWNYTYDQLADSDKVTFHVIEKKPYPANAQQEQELMAYLEQSGSIPGLGPALSKEE